MSWLMEFLRELVPPWWRKAPLPPEGRQPMLPEDVEESIYIASMDMHYGDEPLYYSDPPEWPTTPWTP